MHPKLAVEIEQAQIPRRRPSHDRSCSRTWRRPYYIISVHHAGWIAMMGFAIKPYCAHQGFRSHSRRFQNLREVMENPSHLGLSIADEILGHAHNILSPAPLLIALGIHVACHPVVLPGHQSACLIPITGVYGGLAFENMGLVDFWV